MIQRDIHAWNEYLEIDESDPCERGDFMNGIHAAQRVIGLRVARRTDPDTWRK